jgi:hypothetical protein
MIINDLSATIVDITIPQGSNCAEFFQLYTDDAQTIPLDLTGFVGNCQVRNTYDSKVLLDLNTADGTVMVGAKIENNEIVSDLKENGGIAIFYKPDTSQIKFTGSELECVRDLEITDGVITRRLIQGTLIISRESTRG